MRSASRLLLPLLLAAGIPALAGAPPGASHPAIRQRLADLIGHMDAAQYRTSSLPPDRSFAAGEYPALVDFLVAAPGGFRPLAENVPDASGSTFIGLWFLSEAHRVLGQVDLPGMAPLRGAIRSQIRRARSLPGFFQGTSRDVWECPAETMGWYPLIEGHRLPALVPDAIEQLMPPGALRDLANLSDGDIWAWCMAIDDATPGILQYHLPITGTDIYAPLLGSSLDWESIYPHARKLYLLVRGAPLPPRFPMGTFYGTSAERKQRFSSVVMANILSSIPLLERIPASYFRDLENTASFVRDAARLALVGELSWPDFAYDYHTIPAAPMAYVARAHKRIEEIGRAGYPRLLDADTLAGTVAHISGEAEARLAHPALHRPEGAMAYASLVYCFNAMMNLGVTDPGLFDRNLGGRGGSLHMPRARDLRSLARHEEESMSKHRRPRETPPRGRKPLAPFGLRRHRAVYCVALPRRCPDIASLAPPGIPTRGAGNAANEDFRHGLLVERTRDALLVANPASHTVPGTGPFRLAGPLWADMASIAFVVPPLIEAFSLYLLTGG